MAAKTDRSVILQERDVLLLRGLFEARVMRLVHIAKLYFEGNAETAKKRVQKLKAAGFLREQRGRRAYEAATLSLTRRAFEELGARGALTGYPVMGWISLQKRLDVSESTLKHEWNVVDVKAALSPAIDSRKGLSVTEFSVWPRLCEFTVKRREGLVPVRPDGLLRVEEVREEDHFEHVFFLEVDRGSEDLRTLVAKVENYWAFHRSGELAVRLGEVDPVPFRVLMVFRTPARRQSPSVERRNNVAEQLSLSGTKTFVWLTTLEEVVANPLGRIWTTPAQYKEITEGTPFAPQPRPKQTGPYIRRPERERLIEAELAGRKLSLFE